MPKERSNKLYLNGKGNLDANANDNTFGIACSRTAISIEAN